MAFMTPLFSNVRSRSHCAAGKTYDIDAVSPTATQPAGKATIIIRRLNLPKCVAVMAVSKSAGLGAGFAPVDTQYSILKCFHVRDNHFVLSDRQISNSV